MGSRNEKRKRAMLILMCGVIFIGRRRVEDFMEVFDLRMKRRIHEKDEQHVLLWMCIQRGGWLVMY